MKLVSMVLAAALVPAAALASPNNQSGQNNSSNKSPSGIVEVDAFEMSSGQGHLGVLVEGLTPQLRSYFGAPNNSGLLVAQVSPNSPAARAGLKVGDVITNVENQSVQSADDIIAATSNAQNGNVRIHVIRDHRGVDLQAMVGAQRNPSATSQSRNNQGAQRSGT